MYLIQISLKLVSYAPVNDEPALVYILAWHPAGNKLLSVPMVALFGSAYMCHWGVMSSTGPPYTDSNYKCRI